MSRPNNPDNRYDFTCRVTGKKIKTNPRQFAALASRYNISLAEMDNSYVSREGRAILQTEKLTPDQAVQKYGIHPNVAAMLKATRISPPKPVAAPVAQVVPVAPETSPEPVSLVIIAAVEVEEPEDEYSYDASKDESPAMAHAG